MAAIQAPNPGLSRGTVKLLIDLIEIKLGCIEVYDRDDMRDVRALERARAEMLSLLGRAVPEPAVVRLAGAGDATEERRRIRGAA
ncbi:MAG: hypothetical protein EXQ87_10645 [Alphaproteobacteria bacterium]|nr:hypothetical protein [Alphaproteobacteria bacterium]